MRTFLTDQNKQDYVSNIAFKINLRLQLVTSRNATRAAFNVHNTCAIKFVHTEMHLQNFLLTKESHGHVTLYRFQDKKRSLHLQNTQINNILS